MNRNCAERRSNSSCAMNSKWCEVVAWNPAPAQSIMNVTPCSPGAGFRIARVGQKSVCSA